MPRTSSTTGLAAGCLALVLLPGCASVYRVDSQVESFSRWSDEASFTQASATLVPSAPQRFRFERLPSQSQGAVNEAQAELEAWTTAAMAPLGWAPDPSDPSVAWTIQVGATQSSQQTHSPWDTPWYNQRFGWASHIQIGVGVGVGGGSVMWSPGLWQAERPYIYRKIGLLIRDAKTGRIAYETQAVNESRWSATPSLWQAMLKGALQGFPSPPSGVRTVGFEVPR